MDVWPIVYVFADDDRERAAAVRLLDEWRFAVKAFTSPKELLESVAPNAPDCIVLDLGKSTSSGLDLCRRVSGRGGGWPIVVLAERGDAAQTVGAVQLGASEVVLKPLDHNRLISAVRRAIAMRSQRRQTAPPNDRTDSAAELTPREREVLELIAEGRPTRQVAIDLGISRKTVEVHCFRIKRKFGAKSLSGLLPPSISR